MNYVSVDDCVILRTVPGGEIYRHALNSNCAFEIDKTHEFFESGWSIVVLGRLELATEDDFAWMQSRDAYALGWRQPIHVHSTSLRCVGAESDRPRQMSESRRSASLAHSPRSVKWVVSHTIGRPTSLLR